MQEVAPSPKARWHPVAMPSKSVESVAPPVVVASKVKAVMVESPENPKKKRKLVKDVEVEPKRTKLMSSAMPPTTIIKVTAESSPTFARRSLDLHQAVEAEREDPREVEEEGKDDLPLTVLPLFEPAGKPTPLDVVAGVLGQLVPVEEVAESGEGSGRVEASDGHPISPLEPELIGGEGNASPVLSDQSPEPVEEVGPSSPPQEKIITLPMEPIFQTPPMTATTPDSRA